jgi:hypothetical protein
MGSKSSKFTEKLSELRNFVDRIELGLVTHCLQPPVQNICAHWSAKVLR